VKRLPKMGKNLAVRNAYDNGLGDLHNFNSQLKITPLYDPAFLPRDIKASQALKCMSYDEKAIDKRGKRKKEPFIMKNID